MSEQKFTEAEYTRAAGDYTFCQLAGGTWVSENQSAKYGAMLTQGARAVAEVGAWEQAVRDHFTGPDFDYVHNSPVDDIRNRVAAILREKKEKQGGN
jgi:hypothetical protein